MPPDFEEVGTGRVRLIVIIGALSAFGPLSLDMYLPGLPALARDLGATASEGQLTLTACLLGLALGQMLAGPVSDARGRRGPLLVGVLAYTLASLFCGLAPSIAVLVILRFLQGAAGAAGIVIARAAVRDLYSGAEAARFFSLTILVNGLAPILAPVVGGQLLNVTSWRGVFFVLSAIGAGLWLLAAWGLPETLPRERRSAGGLPTTLHAFRQLLGDRRFLGYAFASGLVFAAMFAYIAGAPFVIEEIYGVSPQGFSLIFGANALGIIAVSQISGRLVGRVRPRLLLAVGLSMACLGGWLLVGAVVANAGLGGILPALFLVVSSVGLVSPNATTLALADYPRAAGSASALLGVLQFIIGACVAPLVGIAGTHTAVPMAVLIALLCSGAAAAFALLTRAAPRPPLAGN